MRSRRPHRRVLLPPALALAAVLAMALALSLSSAQSFERFFATASERRMLDEVRADFQAPAPVVPVAEAAAPSVAPTPSGPVLPTITVSGVVIRGRGGDTSWINGSRIRPDEITPEGIRVRPARGADALVQIQLPDGNSPLSLKPGQRIDLETGSVLEVYERTPAEGSRNLFQPTAPDPAALPPDAGGG